LSTTVHVRQPFEAPSTLTRLPPRFQLLKPTKQPICSPVTCQVLGTALASMAGATTVAASTRQAGGI
jgi:hypothetical protein